MPRPDYDHAILEKSHDAALEFIRTLDQRPVHATATVEELRSRIVIPLADEPVAPSEVIQTLASAGLVGAIGSAGPRYFGFVIGASFPIAVGADWLATAWDQNAGIYATSPISAVVEEAAARYVLDLLKLPSDAGVGFVTGCQMANFTALAAARHHVLLGAGWDVEERGLNGGPRVNIILSEEAHATVLFALRLLGFGIGNAIRIPTDDQGRMVVSEMAKRLEQCDGPTIVCTQAGNVNSGSFDPIGEIADAAHAKNAWVHVDGAFGLWARAVPTLADLAGGSERADSWATDAHKWLNVPYDCGIVIVRHRDSQRASMSVKAAYLQHAEGAERDNFDWVPEFSRRARAVPLYATLRHLGRSGVRDLIERCCAHARRFAELLGSHDGIEIANEVVLNQVIVRFHRPGADSDALTHSVVAAVQRDGTLWLSGTTWKGGAAMRISVSGWSTTEADIEESARTIIRLFRDLA